MTDPDLETGEYCACGNPMYSTGCDAPGCPGCRCDQCGVGCDIDIDPGKGRCATALAEAAGGGAANDTPAPPMFPCQYSGVDLTWIGDDGIMAFGHVPFYRFLEGANLMARHQRGMRGLAHDRGMTWDDLLDDVRHCWAIPVADPDGRDGDWRVVFRAAEAPGAFAVTLYDPEALQTGGPAP